MPSAPRTLSPGRPEVVVLGLGPVGRAVARTLAERGHEVLACDPAPERQWTATYGLWESQCPQWLTGSIIARYMDVPLLSVPRGEGTAVYPLRFDSYVVVDTERLWAELVRAHPRIQVVTAAYSAAAAARIAPVVVDCRGPRPRARAEPLQRAFGLKVPLSVARPVMSGAEGDLMRWNAETAGGASFLYAVPLGRDTVLLEETAVATYRLELAELRERLRRRLAHAGVPEAEIAALFGGVGAGPAGAPAEVVEFPLLPPPWAAAKRAGREGREGRGTSRGDRTRGGGSIIGFGGAGGYLHPATGYSLGISFAALDQLADAVAGMLSHAPQPGRGRERGGLRPWFRRRRFRALTIQAAMLLQSASAVLQADWTDRQPRALLDLFAVFGRLSPADQRRFFCQHRHLGISLLVYLRIWLRAPTRLKLRLAAGLGGGLIRATRLMLQR